MRYQRRLALVGAAVLFVYLAFSPLRLFSRFPFAKQSIRIFGPSSDATRVLQQSPLLHHQVFSKDDRLWYIEAHGDVCWPGLVTTYHQSSSLLQMELWKYCFIYMGHGNVYQDGGVTWFVNYADILKPRQSLAILIEEGNGYHGSFLQLSQKSVARQMCRILVETPQVQFHSDPHLLSAKLMDMMTSVKNKIEFMTQCRELAAGQVDEHLFCPLKGGFCCQVVQTDDQNNQVLAALQHPLVMGDDEVQISPEDAFVSSITVHFTGEEPATSLETPNYFDILLENDCLPTTKSCHKCLKRSNSCADCIAECACYCKALCKIRPPKKIVTQTWLVHPPPYSKDPSRLIPRLVHQTWFEDVTEKQYPNMSRLIESWKTSGWEYAFYNDDTAREFLVRHFPPPVVEAYDAILPGAFKADLFRYCVLLIKGGVYADMDVLLETNLDAVFASDVGFMVPIDEPGTSEGHRSCLWNGLLAVTPGHPFIAQTIELVVNNIRNRFTSVDYDDMLCPNPVLSVSHTVDTLFTCGPCILGAAMNKVLGRHMQSQWELNDLDVWKMPSGGSGDPRHRIRGRSIVLAQNKQDMGAHRFTWLEHNLLVAATDMPDYDDRPPTKQHYSRTHEKIGVYGLRNLYNNNNRSNEEIRITVSG
jgi:hypothetical protein